MTNAGSTRMLARGRLTALSVFVIMTGSLLAQTSPPATTSPPTFRAGTALVQVDVVVRDGKGQFVGNLTKDDFQVFEDGKPQTIQTFSLVGRPNGGLVAGNPAPDAPAAPR